MKRLLESGIPVLGSLVLILALSFGCGDDKPNEPNGGDEESLVFTRADSSAVQFHSTARAYVWCGPWEEGNVLTPALHVWFGSLVEVETPGWDLKAVYGDFSVGDTLRFPSSFIWDHPDSASIFVSDPPNELDSGTEEATGWIVFRQIPCAGAGEVEFDIDAVLGSELADMPSLKVRGRYRHSVTDPPPWIGK